MYPSVPSYGVRSAGLRSSARVVGRSVGGSRLGAVGRRQVGRIVVGGGGRWVEYLPYGSKTGQAVGTRLLVAQVAQEGCIPGKGG